MSFRDALNDTYLYPTKEERETLVAQLEEFVPQAQACASYKELRALAVRNIVAWLLFRHAHYAQGTCLHEHGMSGETKFMITQWVVKALADYLDHLKEYTLPAFVNPPINPNIKHVHGHPWATVSTPDNEHSLTVSLTQLRWDEDGGVYLLAFEGCEERRLYLKTV